MDFLTFQISGSNPVRGCPARMAICAGNEIAANLAALRAGEAHLWMSFTEPDPGAAGKSLWHMLSDEERERAGKISLADNRMEFVLAHALVRAGLSQYHPVAPGAWQFGRGPHGKPFISAPAAAPPLQFNLTHTRGLAACVITLDAAAGVDAELMEPHADLLGVARQFFGAEAVRELESLSGEQPVVRFYAHWTRQEACRKGSGIGLSAQPRVNETLADWQFIQRRVSPRHILAAVICRGQGMPTVFRLRTVGWQVRGGECRLVAREPERAMPAQTVVSADE